MDIEELETFFTSRELPETLQLNRSTRITDMKGFLDASFLQVRMLGIDAPAFWRLLQVRDKLLESQPEQE